MKSLYTATAVSTGGRSGNVVVNGSSLAFEMSPPAEMGGTKPGVNPEQLFAAGYAACFGSALQHVVRVRKLHIPAPDVRLTVGIDKDESGGFYLSAQIEGVFQGIEQSLADELVKEAHTVCPYSKATMGNMEVTLSATAKQQSNAPRLIVQTFLILKRLWNRAPTRPVYSLIPEHSALY